MSEVIRMSNVISKEVEWFWKPYIALGKVTCLEGDPGIGKSFLLAALASHASHGLLPDGSALPSPLGKSISIIANAEDDIADTVKVRLDAMNANSDLIYMFKDCPVYDDKGAAKIAAAVAQYRPALVTVDPLAAYVGAKVNMNQANHMRAVINQLKDIADHYGCAVIVARHLNKSMQENPKYKGGGTIDITAACRSVLTAVRSGEDECTVKQIKCNNAKEGQAFTFKTTPEGGFEWGSYTDTTAEDMFAERSVSESAEDFLKVMLGRDVRSKQNLLELAQKRNPPISDSSLKRAAGKLGVTYKRVGSETVWELPKEALDD